MNELTGFAKEGKLGGASSQRNFLCLEKTRLQCDIRTSERNGLVVNVVSVREIDDIMLITTGGMVNRTHVREIRVVGRNTQGVRIVNLNEGDKIASLAQVAREEPEEEAQPVESSTETPPSA